MKVTELLAAMAEKEVSEEKDELTVITYEGKSTWKYHFRISAALYLTNFSLFPLIY